MRARLSPHAASSRLGVTMNAHACRDPQVCTYVRENRNYGSTSFDNIFTGILSIFVAITLEGWSVSAQVGLPSVLRP